MWTLPLCTSDSTPAALVMLESFLSDYCEPVLRAQADAYVAHMRGEKRAHLAGLQGALRARQAHGAGAALAVFPELCVSSYAIEDLLLQATLLDAVETGVARLVEESAGLTPLLRCLQNSGRINALTD